MLDFIFALIGLIVFSPLFLLFAALIKFDSNGPVLFKQIRIGKNKQPFTLFKFRTMTVDTFNRSLLTVGSSDSRITKAGYILRKYKLDELPQLINIIFGEMSFVGPRPEVEKYVKLYTPEQEIVFTVKPGLTDYASLKYRNESDILAAKNEPESYYVNVIMQDKIALYIKYINEMSFLTDLKLVLKTLLAIFK